MTYYCIPIPSFAVWEEEVFDVMPEQCDFAQEAYSLARDTTRGHVARPGIWFGPDTQSRALKSVVHVVWSKHRKLGSR